MSWGGKPPDLKAKNNPGLVAEALGHMQARGGGCDELAACFEQLVPQIQVKGGGFRAARMQGVDGSWIFVGEIGHALVIAPDGALFLGALEMTPAANASGVGVVFEGAGLRPEYTNLRRYEP